MGLIISNLPGSYQWQDAFVLLGVRRCTPLWQHMGIPVEVVQSPAAIIGAAREFVLEVRQLASRGITEALEPDIRAALVRLNERLGRDYEGGSVDKVFAWAARYFVREFPTWNTWWHLLSSFVYRPSRDLEDGLSPPDYNWIMQALQIRYGPSARAELEGAVDAASAIPLGPVESKMVVIDAGSRSSSDPELFDVVLAAKNVSQLNRAYTFWIDLQIHVSASGIETFMGVARRRASELHDPGDAGLVNPLG